MTEVENGETELKETKTTLEETKTTLEETKTALEEAKTSLEKRDAVIKDLRAKLTEMEEAAKKFEVVDVIKAEVSTPARVYAAQDGDLKDVSSPTSSTSSFFDTVLIRDASSGDESNTSCSSASVSPTPIPTSNSATSSIPSTLPILEASQQVPAVDAHGRSKRQRTTVSTYNVKVLAGTAIHTPQKFNKGPVTRASRKRKRTSSGEAGDIIEHTPSKRQK